MAESFNIEQLTARDIGFLRDMVYASAYVPEGHPPFPRSILDDPSVAKFYEEWGSRRGDIGRKAIQDGEPVGAVWLRRFSEGPELGIAVCEPYRGQGIGRQLLGSLEAAAACGYERLVLSVDPRNPAVRLYERAGYRQTGWDGSFWRMEKLLERT